MTANRSISALRPAWLPAALFYLGFIAAAWACSANPIPTPMSNVLCDVVGFFHGNMGRGLASLAVIMVGVGALLGKVSWVMAVTVGIGISVMFGANALTCLLTGYRPC